MARPGLHKNPKFRRLVHMLKLPESHVRGYLECLWDVAYENGLSRIGDVTDVELAAMWPGEPGALCSALVSCGGERHGFLECHGNEYFVHDLFDHAPDYVMDRSKREIERKKDKLCAWCGETYRSKDKRSRFCSDACRQNNHRHPVTESHGHERKITESNGTPAPALAPAPAPAPPRNPPPLTPATSVAGSVTALPSGEGEEVSREALIATLRSCGVNEADPAVTQALRSGVSLREIAAIVSYWRSKYGAWGSGALHHRIRRARPGEKPSDHWPEVAPDFARKQARQAEDAGPSAPVKKLRANGEAQDREREAAERDWGAKLDALTGEGRESLLSSIPKTLGKRPREWPLPKGLQRDWALAHVAKQAKAGAT